MAKMYIKNCTGNENAKKMPGRSSIFLNMISRFIFYMLLISFFGVSFYMFFFSGYLKMSNIKITGNNEINSFDIQNSLSGYLQVNFLKIIPKDNFLFISEKKVSELLKNNFKKIRAVTVSKEFPDSISINIDERKAVLVWCSGEKCFLIDENGTAYSVADFNSSEISQNHLIRINDMSERDIAIGQKITDYDFEQYVIGIKNALKGIDLKINSGDDAYSTPSNVANEIDVKVESDVKIYFSTQFSLMSAIDSLDIIFKKEITRDKLESIEYIDLRSEGKVFYKFKENNTENNKEQSQ